MTRMQLYLSEQPADDGGEYSQDVGRYFYNSEGKRCKKVENGESTYYLYSGESLLCERKPDGTIVYYVYLNGKQITKVERKNGVDEKFFYHTDHLGSTRAITNEQGNVIGRFEYQPFDLEESTTTGMIHFYWEDL